MPAKPATVLLLAVMILIATALAQSSLAAAPTIELAQAHNADSREACDHAGGRYEEGPGYFACIDGRRSREAACAERERGSNPCSKAAPPGTLGLIQRVWIRLENFRMGR